MPSIHFTKYAQLSRSAQMFLFALQKQTFFALKQGPTKVLHVQCTDRKVQLVKSATHDEELTFQIEYTLPRIGISVRVVLSLCVCVSECVRVCACVCVVCVYCVCVGM